MQAYSFLMPRRFLRGSYLSLSLTVVALACGVAMVCAIDLANAAVLRAFVEVVDAMSGRAALLVRAGEGGLFPEEVADAVGRVPGVELADPLVVLSQPDSVILTRAFAGRRGLAVGDVTHSAVAAAYAERTIELLDGRIVRDIRTSRPLTDGEGAAPVDGSRRPPI